MFKRPSFPALLALVGLLLISTAPTLVAGEGPEVDELTAEMDQLLYDFVLKAWSAVHRVYGPDRPWFSNR